MYVIVFVLSLWQQTIMIMKWLHLECLKIIQKSVKLTQAVSQVKGHASMCFICSSKCHILVIRWLGFWNTSTHSILILVFLIFYFALNRQPFVNFLPSPRELNRRPFIHIWGGEQSWTKGFCALAPRNLDMPGPLPALQAGFVSE